MGGKTSKISVDRLLETLECDAENGILVWRARPRRMFKSDRACNAWNSVNAGKVAFTSLNDSGYYRGTVDCVHLRAHRVIWAMHYGKWPSGEIDHINGVRTDNRIANLRDIPKALNQRNMKIPRNNTSGHIGVRWRAHAKAWCARIVENGVDVHLGYFKEYEEACAARLRAQERLNFHENHGRTCDG